MAKPTLNWGEVNKQMKENKREGGGGSRRFQLKDGESTPVRFLVNENEPFIFKRHYSQAVKRYLVCAEDAHANGTHAGCVGCYEAKRQGKNGNIKAPARVFAFSVFDPRKYHMLDEEVDGSKFKPCSDDAKCKWCRKGVEQKSNGVCHWSIPGSVAEQLQTFERDLLGKKCATCQIGTIKVTEYVCPKCEEPLDVDDPNEEYRCFECGKGSKNIVMVKPQEVIVCSKGCKKPRRTSMADAWVVITRSGESTSTTYNFSPGEVEPINEEWKNVDFASHPDYKPVPANEQAAVLGITNPFGNAPKGKASAADEDDDEDEAPQAKPVTPRNLFGGGFRR